MRSPGAIALLVALIIAPMTARAQDAPAQAVPPPVAAAEPQATGLLDSDPSAIVGMDIAAAFSRFGPPATLLAVRGDEPWQDDVLLGYPQGYGLYVFKGQVWQVRFASPYAGPVLGLFVGDALEKAYSLLGSPLYLDASLAVWELPRRGFPMRLRAIVRDGLLVELYVQRADF